MYDTLIIGAGMAGLSAARALAHAGKKVAILEARDRIGGRVWTDYNFAKFPIELGAEFIHGEKAITHQFLREAGLKMLPVDRYGKLRWGNPMAQSFEQMPDVLRTRLKKLLQTLDDLEFESIRVDCSLGDYLFQKGFSFDDIGEADVLLAQTNCASVYTLSIQDLRRELKHSAGPLEFRIQDGYQGLLDFLSQGLEIYLSNPVIQIDTTRHVSIKTLQQIFMAKNCIVTIPVSLLQHNTITFIPELSQEKQKSINAFNMQGGTKLIYSFSRAFWDHELSYMLHQSITPRWWTPGYGRQDANVICSFITADAATSIDMMRDDVALKQGLEDLSKLLEVDIFSLQENLLAFKRISWANERYTRGAYAHIPPGAAWAREALAKPEGRLFFAGEATAYHSTPQTVHGAIDSGLRAASEVLNS